MKKTFFHNLLVVGIAVVIGFSGFLRSTDCMGRDFILWDLDDLFTDTYKKVNFQTVKGGEPVSH